MSATPAISIRQCFADLPDPRREHNRKFLLWDVLAVTICAVVGGANNWVEVAKYGQRKLAFLRTLLDLPNGIPAHDTFGRIFALLDPAALQRGFHNWMQALVELSDGRLVAVDGKTLRQSFDTAAGKGPLHLVSAWATANRLTLAQQAVDDKSNEITAIPELLKMLDLKRAIVTIDAMGCQKAIAAQIDAAGGDYVLALKENQETLYREVQELFLAGLENDFADLEHHYHRTIDEDHGRRETRHYHVVPVPKEWAERCSAWPGLRTLGMVFSERQVGQEQPTGETRFFIASIAPKVRTFARAVRGHWDIENGLHWVLDVTFREDASRLRKDHGPENLALLRRLAVGLLHQDDTSKVGVACKRKEAGWDNDYLLQVLSASLR